MEEVSEYQMHHDRILFFIMLSAPTSRARRVSTGTLVTLPVREHSPWVALRMQTSLFKSFARFTCESVYHFQGNSGSNISNIFVILVFTFLKGIFLSYHSIWWASNFSLPFLSSFIPSACLIQVRGALFCQRGWKGQFGFCNITLPEPHSWFFWLCLYLGEIIKIFKKIS